MKKAHICLLDAQRGVYSEYKANRVAEIDEQMTFVQESLVEQVATASAQKTEETDSAEIVTVQEYMQEKAEEEKESNS